MLTRSDEILLPVEIIELITQYVICSNFSAIFTYRSLSSWMREMVDGLCKHLSEELFGVQAEELQKRVVSKTRSSFFFKLALSEVRRLKFSADWLKKEDDFPDIKRIHRNRLQLHDQRLQPLAYGMFKEIQEKLWSLAWQRIQNLKLEGVAVLRNDVSLPRDLKSFILRALNARAFETIGLLCDLIQANPRVNEDRIIDEIYIHAAHHYNDLEFIQLKNIIPIELNRQVAYTDPSRASRFKTPLLHHAANVGNLNLVQYLIENGVDVDQPSEDGKVLMKSIAKNLEYNKKDNDRYSNLLATAQYLKEHIDSLSKDKKEKRFFSAVTSSNKGKNVEPPAKKLKRVS